MHFAGLDLVVNDALTDPVLDRPTRVEELALSDKLTLEILLVSDILEPDHRSPADAFRDVVHDALACVY